MRSVLSPSVLRLLLAAACAAPLAAAAAPPAPPADAIELASVYALVGDLATGEVLYTKHADVAAPIASVTKLMTAMVALDGGQSLDEWVTIVRWSKNPNKNAYSRLRVGSEVKRGELLKIAVMSSENLASYTLAHHYPGGVEGFVTAMNTKARALGMTDTHFDDPTGLSTGNRASASDLWKMVNAAFEYEPIRSFSTTYQHTVQFRNPSYALAYGNTNPLTASGNWDVQLSKTGYLTEAGRCLVMVAEIDDRPVAIVLLNSFGSRTPLGDAGRVRRWLTTGHSGSVAGPARDYEQRLVSQLDRRPAVDSTDD